ncbi:hypothetical protein [Hymenobacter sp. B81]|uniref:hypothetical protein n=1 Tax=Hymenobacter sp. B81 TaxID=3344878 RepID=UPI0037DC6EB4
MPLLYRALVLAAQSVLTFGVMWFVYLLFAWADYEGGIDGLIGFTLFQPLLGAVFSGGTVAVCLLFGLPIRVSGPVRRWWLRHAAVQRVLLLAGIALLGLSGLYATTVTAAEGLPRQVPNLPLAAAGWSVTAFALLHSYPSPALQRWAARLTLGSDTA